MMASNILSRLLPAGVDGPSIYETMRQQEQRSDTSDVEDHAAMEGSLGDDFHNQDMERLLADAAQSRATMESAAFLPNNPRSLPSRQQSGSRSKPKWMRRSPAAAAPVGFDDDEDVPASLLLEGARGHVPAAEDKRRRRKAATELEELPPPVPGPSTQNTQAQWEAARAQQRLHDEDQDVTSRKEHSKHRGNAMIAADPREREMWRWANVHNLDAFLADVYQYFVEHGIWSMILRRAIRLLSAAFVFGFSTFLTACVDYKKIPESTKMKEIVVAQCTKKMSGWYNVLIWVFVLLWMLHLFRYVAETRSLWHMHNFYHHLLDIPDREIQTVSWQLVVSRLMALRDANPTTALNLSPEARRFVSTQSKQRMDAHDIANRLMRRENYLIAMFNKDILDLTLPIPFLGSRQFLSRTMLFNIGFAIMDFAFDEHGQLRTIFLTQKYRRQLAQSLERRIRFAAVMNVVMAPFVVFYFVATYFYSSFTEYHRNPAELGTRLFTPYAEWKFREFNELGHLFQRRKNMAYPYANRYLEQFPKDKTFQLYNFVAFITGALAAVLGLASLLDPELFLGFEITPNKTVIFWLGVLGSIYAAARAAVPEETLVLDPELALRNVIDCTRYCPASWQGRLHSDEVREEFAQLYKLKIIIVIEELLSMVFAPFILLFSLPKSSERIIDFFREFTVHVDGLGHVCSFAVFDFKKGDQAVPTRPAGQAPDPNGLRDDYYSTKDGKMVASYYGFIDEYGFNPLKGSRYARAPAKRRFNPPPAFPGLASPGIAPEAAGPVNRHGLSHHMRQSSHRTPRFGPAAGHISPIHSILLDSHHQPPLYPAQRAQSRFRSARQPVAEPDGLEEEDEAGPSQHLPPQQKSSSKIMEEDSELGDSWRTTRAAHVGGTDEEGDGSGVADQGAGVLGLLYQFQKAQAEGRGAM